MSQKVKIINKLGMHLRAAAVFIKTANLFKADVTVEHQKKKINGKSIMGLMALAAGNGTELVIHTKGADAKRCLDELTKLVSNRFGESE